MYFLVLLGAHSILCIFLIGLVLLQQGKGADAGATFGGGGGNTVFGAAGSADFITKLTTGLAISFMVTSILLIRAYSAGGASVLASGPQDVLGGSVMSEAVKASEAAREKSEATKEKVASGDEVPVGDGIVVAEEVKKLDVAEGKEAEDTVTEGVVVEGKIAEGKVVDAASVDAKPQAAASVIYSDEVVEEKVEEATTK